MSGRLGMFKKKWWAGRIDSDEGFSVWLGRDALVYREGKRRMVITIDFGGSQVVIFEISIGRWDDDPNNAVDEKEKARIADNLKRAIESQGYTASFM